MYDCLDESVPLRAVGASNGESRYPPWFSIDLVRKIRRKNHLHNLLVGNRASQAGKNFEVSG